MFKYYRIHEYISVKLPKDYSSEQDNFQTQFQSGIYILNGTLYILYTTYITIILYIKWYLLVEALSRVIHFRQKC